MTIEATLTASDGAELHYAEDGSGEPLLLLHDLTGTGADWAHVFELEALSALYRVIRPDARGHGRSTDPAGAFTFRRCALDVLELLDHLGIERARAIGMSLGAETLLHVATAAPMRVTSMVLVSAAPRFPAETRKMLRTAAAAPHTPEEWDAMREVHVHGDAQIEALWRLPAKLAADRKDSTFTAKRLRSVAARTLVVAGDRDPLYPVELAVELYRGIPSASLYVVPGGGHGPIVDGERESFVARALAFLGPE
jgi:pimeloyl-ACP methyl ester carboxylesterase